MIGTRIQMHPATDHWMRGDRFGTIIGYSRKRKNPDTGCVENPVRIKLDVSGKIARDFIDNLTLVEDRC